VSTPLALLLFGGGLAASLVASEFLVRGFARLGAKLGLAAGLIGLLIALGADGPEISSSITASLGGARDVGLGVILGSNLFNLAALLGLSSVIAGRITFHRVLLWLDGGICLLATLLMSAMLLGSLPPVIALILLLIGFVFYIAVLAAQPHRISRLAIPRRARARLAAAARMVHTDLRHGEAPQIDHEASWRPVFWLLPSVAVIVAGSYAMVNGALSLGDRWHLPRSILGAVVLAAITSLPNAYAASRLALLGNGTAVLSLAMNSNTLNLLAGVAIPAVVFGGLLSRAAVATDIAWLLAMMLLAIALGAWQRGLNRVGGIILIAAYGCFIVFALR
jgi:cation:H+ antiporter